jgi:TFIIF-interacting CTD phosphatase-like protein
VGRPLQNTIIIDNSPNSYQFQPENGIPILSWYEDPNDNELMRFVPALKMLADDRIDDVRPIILQSVANNEWHPEFCAKICSSLF